MKLYEQLPDCITVNGRTYRVDLDFRNVLRMSDILNRKDLLQGAKIYHALRCVMKHPPRDTSAAMDALMTLLFPPDPAEGQTKGTAEKLTDYVQDADMIRAAFLQSYKINLWRDRLHWFEFTALLRNLPEGSRYTDVLSIRARPMPEPTRYNEKERQWLAEAKARFAVRMTEQEREDKLQQSFHATTMSLLALAKRGSGKIGEGHTSHCPD